LIAPELYGIAFLASFYVQSMQFNNLTFVFFFLPIVLSGYLLLRTTRWANLFMLAASLYFYG
jgi:hypothetical protein